MFVSASSADKSGGDDDDKCVPRAAVHKVIKDCAPNIRVSGEAKEFFVQCCNEFIHLLSSEANSVCEKQTKKLIHPDHIVSALENLGFGSYKANCRDAMETAQEELAQKRKKLSSKPSSNFSEEELRQQQEALFEQAREEQLQLEIEEWHRTQEISKEILRQKMEASRTEDDNYD
ncbi:unnamed protein product [Didymodactylos carnosus]|uniref:Protein Dr1 n=1 Tax=Didymodactylos carnosus TaxID=1234261 RepID=A0A815FCX9_9BILA|nr:unnamed protein product [Didymodactylos carnosus]CAF1323586.1 unnamed protein product [Didymodactylos carnosus]CAF3605171.1 unnamed protein product [Didymodactylos carnosus]CAF4171424.1 unnamed protein product [Didymodactylos carnosus]